MAHTDRCACNICTRCTALRVASLSLHRHPLSLPPLLSVLPSPPLSFTPLCVCARVCVRASGTRRQATWSCMRIQETYLVCRGANTRNPNPNTLSSKPQTLELTPPVQSRPVYALQPETQTPTPKALGLNPKPKHYAPRGKRSCLRRVAADPNLHRVVHRVGTLLALGLIDAAADSIHIS